jgi:hypothetical protein
VSGRMMGEITPASTRSRPSRGTTPSPSPPQKNRSQPPFQAYIEDADVEDGDVEYSVSCPLLRQKRPRPRRFRMRSAVDPPPPPPAPASWTTHQLLLPAHPHPTPHTHNNNSKAS